MQDYDAPRPAFVADPERGAEMFENFLEFPTPLALLNAHGQMEVANISFWRRFGEAGINSNAYEMVARTLPAGWRQIDLPLEQASGEVVRACAVRLMHHILLIVDDAPPLDRDRELESLRERLADVTRLASTDYLTGAWNRAHLDRVLGIELARSLTRREPLTLLLFDVDCFKSVNDRYGHVAGDGVLRELAGLVRTRLRGSDMLFRWGGEEFVVLLSSAGYRSAARIAENVRECVAEHRFDVAGALTISIGVAEYLGDEAVHTWFQRLDAAMYRAKRAGRNRVEVDDRGNSDVWSAAGAGAPLHLIWQEGYESGHPLIDAQHRELFRLANRLIDVSLQEPVVHEELREALEQLIAHIDRHFADEEELLKRLNYADFAEHHRAHEALLRRAVRMQSLLNNCEVGAGAIVEFLARDVVSRHLLGVDVAFFPVVRAAHQGEISRARGE